ALGASGYWPSLTEWLFSIGFTAGTMVVFTMLAEWLPGVIGDRTKVAAAERVQLKAAADD
ncbi:MAG TPA: hypothetical protein VNT01_16465, partial [Symbiobacteriaceae bacterium]|nr:hypothetical protein [Symbiobacteriaceae bacterium]